VYAGKVGAGSAACACTCRAAWVLYTLKPAAMVIVVIKTPSINCLSIKHLLFGEHFCNCKLLSV
jgi:hypothetical protein